MSKVRTRNAALIVRVGLTAGLVASFVFTGIGSAGLAGASTPGEACMFNAPTGATTFGHVGWGFRDGTGDSWTYGADEGGGPIPTPPGSPKAIEAWHANGSQADMLHAFGIGANYGRGSGFYIKYRCITVPSSFPGAAASAITSVENSGYNVLTDNCLTKAVIVLGSYGLLNLPGASAVAPNYYFDNDLPAIGFGAVEYFTTLTIGLKVVDPLNGDPLNMHPQHTQRPIRILIYDQNGQQVYDSGFAMMADVTPGTDRYQATFQLPSPEITPVPLSYYLWSGTYTVQAQLQYTLLNTVSGPIDISQGENNTAPDTPVTAGDINGDGQVDIADYNLLMQCFSDLLPPVGPCPASLKAAADIDDDGAVNGTDYNELLRIFLSQGHE